MTAKMPSDNLLMIGAGIVGVAIIGWMVSRAMDKITAPGALAGIGEGIGTGAVDLTMGVLGGINDTLGIPRTSDVIAAANDPAINPLQPFGSWLGISIYDLTH